jgi:peroxiredoxin Q/BCP
MGYAVIGVSPDNMTKHKKFETKFKLPYTLIADTGNKIISKYGVWAEKQLFGRKYMGVVRTTFVIDEKGCIRKIFQRPKVKNHAAEILEAMIDS